MDLTYYSELPGFLDNENSLHKIDSISKLSEQYHFTGTLIFHHHGSMDPWYLASRVLHTTTKLIPLVATQPYSIPPFSVVKALSTISNLLHRKVNLNLITGVSEMELSSVHQTTDPTMKYARLEEYIRVLKGLLHSKEPLTFDGNYYKFNKLRLAPYIQQEHIPELFVPGSSKDSIRIAQAHGDTALLRPAPIHSFKEEYCSRFNTDSVNLGIRVSVISRSNSGEAWEAARRKFPANRSGVVKAKIRKNMLSHNTKLMADLALSGEVYDNIYWMGAYLNGLTEDPFLVGSYEEVAAYLQKYVNCGVTTFLFGDLNTEQDFIHINKTLRMLETLRKEAIS
ncbi:LLM class flavin-dependent oxidoreductase [Paenibacillus sp. YSY-4.3]